MANATLTSSLRAEKRKLSSEQARIRKELEKKADRLRDIQGQLVHINALLGKKPPTPGEVIPSIWSTNVADIAAEILEERGGEDMHYKELARAVLERGGKLGGKRPEGVLVTRLINDGRFIRPLRRGYYALRKHHPKAKNIGERNAGEND